MLKLKLQHFGHLMRRVDSLEKTRMLGGIGGRRKLSHPYMTTGKTVTLTRWTFVGKVMSLLFNTSANSDSFASFFFFSILMSVFLNCTGLDFQYSV